MGEKLYLMPLLFSLALSLTLCLGIISIAKRLRIVDTRIGERHLHKKHISRFGGIAIALAFLLTLLWDRNLVVSQSMWAILGGLFVLAIGGVADDVRQLSWKKQILIQVAAVLFAFWLGAFPRYVSNPFGEGLLYFSSPLLVLMGVLVIGGWVIALMNTINWIDGIDGVGAGVALIGAVTLFFLSLKPEVNQPPVAIMSVAFAGAVGGFLFLNFYPARIFAGTAGAVGMGYLLAILSIFAGGKVATTLLVMAIPIVDAFWVILSRFREGKSIFKPDNRHLHHALIVAGFSERQVCVTYCAVTMVIAGAALSVGALGKVIVFSIALGCVSLTIGIIRYKSVKIGYAHK